MSEYELMTWDDVYGAICTCNPNEADRFRLCRPNWPEGPIAAYLVQMLRREATEGYLGKFEAMRHCLEQAAQTIEHYAGQR